jgi:hypothetical protein
MRVYPFENPNVAAGFALLPMVVGAAFALAGWRGRVSPRTGLGGLALFLACGAAVVSSGSASAVVAGVGALVLLTVVSLHGAERRTVMRAVCAIVLLAGVGLLLSGGTWSSWVRRQLGARPAMWRGGFELVRQRPLWGWGLGSFVVSYARVHPLSYAAGPYASDIVENAHCLPLHVTAELGVVGLVLGGWVGVRALRNIRRGLGRATSAERPLLRGILCGGLAMLVQGLASTSVHQIECNVNLVIALALAGGLSGVWWRRNDPETGRHLVPRLLAAALVLAAFLATSLPGLLSQVHLRAAHWTDPDDVQTRLTHLRRATAATWPTLDTLKARTYRAALLDRSGRTVEALDQIRVIDSMAPNFGKTRRHRADLALRTHHLTEAAQALISYCRKDPFDPLAYDIWRELARTAARAGRPGLARPEEAARLLGIAQLYRSHRLGKGEVERLRQWFLDAAGARPRPKPDVAPAAPSG